ncbi:prostacyclin receptor isoform X1 [Hypanus sabinus]|uniref:prostacyclin receptor isoform X1 n=1 Tax=Hypanus sabinus TaxID=79690 RepID=UPI0028C422DD|nr:prostacyclin receptor isoform X1 [Hypanus sabinus]
MNNSSCDEMTEIPTIGTPLVSIVMFLLGLLGNLLALVILGMHRKELRAKSSVFLILVTGLVVTDLLGTCFLSPIVFVEYAKKKSMIGLAGGRTLCNLFSTAMIFFGLAPTLILCAMAVERCLAISYPYYYSQHVNRTYAKTVLPAIYIFSFLFCVLPMLDFGKHKQYCPGTWCFVDMKSADSSVVAFSLLYASLIAFLIVAILLCNASVIVSLCKMRKGQRSRRGSVLTSQKRRRSVFGQREEEVDHLILLALMTTIFGICSLPLTIQGFANAIRPEVSDAKDLVAFRLYSLNPILDPWLFILFRKSMFRSVQQLLCCCHSSSVAGNNLQDPLKQQSISLC